MRSGQAVVTASMLIGWVGLVGPVPSALAESRDATSGKPTLAVLDIETPEAHASLGAAVADALTAAFTANPDFTVVERRRVAEVFREQGLGQTGAVLEDSAIELGKLLGAQQLVIGSLRPSGDGFRVDARRVDAESARVLAATSVIFGTSEAVGLAAKELATSLVGGAPTALSASQMRDAASEIAGAVRARLPRVKARISKVDDLGWAVTDAGSKKGAFAGLKMVVYGKDFASGSRERRGIFLVRDVDTNTASGPTRSETAPVRAGDTVEALPSTLSLSGPASAREAIAAAFRGLPQFQLTTDAKADLSGVVSVDGAAMGARRLVLQVFDGTGGLITEFTSSPSF